MKSETSPSPSAAGAAVVGPTSTDEGRSAQPIEDRLKISEEQFHAIFDQSMTGMVLTDLNGVVQRVNPAFCEIIGYAPGEVIGRDGRHITHPDDLAHNIEVVKQFEIGQRHNLIFEKRYIHKGGATIWTQISLSAARDLEGKPASLVGIVEDITEQKQTRQTLLEREQNLRSIFESVTDYAIFTTDAVGIITSWNFGAERIFGYAAAEIVGQESAVLWTPEDRAKGAHEMEIHLARTTGSADDTRWHLRKDGTRFFANGAMRPLLDETGNLRGFTKVCRDVTAQRQAEQALRESEQRFRFLSDLGVATNESADPEQVMETVCRELGRSMRVSRCAYADVEADSEHFTIQHDYTDGCASTTGNYVLSLFGPLAADKQRLGQTLIVNDVDAELAPDEGADMFNAIGVKAIICCPLVKAGRLAAMMAVHQTVPRRWTADEVALVEVVVERSWAYIERARTTRALAQSEARFRLLADTLPQIVWAAQPDGVLDYTNQRWLEYIDQPAEAVSPNAWGEYVHPEDLSRAGEAWAASIRTGVPYIIEFRVRGADSLYRWFLVRALPIRNEGGDIIRWYGTCTDIHTQKELQAQNELLLASERAARAEAERTSRMKDEFLATLSHELRTPLNAIMGWSQVLRGGPLTDEELEQGLSTIERNARAQTQIIEDLLDMSRIISGKVRMDVQRVNLAAIVEAAIQTVRPAADAKGIRIQTVLDPLGQPVSGDPNRLQQVFWNLLSNAVKFTRRNGRVQVLLQRVNSHLEVRVTDDGEGIAPEFLPQVFDRFQQADATTTRRHGGLGLGLAIVKQLVELHGGTAQASSPGLGQGSTFVVSLPVLIIHAEDNDVLERRHPQSGTAEPVAAEAGLRLDGIRVLTVDDEADARTLIKRLLEARGADVRTAASAEEALTMLQAQPADVLVSDIGMPNEDGYSLIRQVRALGLEGGGAIPAIALTAYARTEDRMKAVLAGFQMHLAKPVEAGELLTMVASLTGRTGNPAQTVARS